MVPVLCLLELVQTEVPRTLALLFAEQVALAARS